MTIEKRIKILIEAEVAELYNPPALNVQDQRFYFALNDLELTECKKIRERSIRCMFVALVGYFKVKPVVLDPKFHQIKHDLKFISTEVFQGPGFRPFNISQKVHARLYQRIFKLVGYQRWENILHKDDLKTDLTESATSWVQPRSLFDRAIEYLSAQKIPIPGYTTLQDIISEVITAVNSRFTTKIEHNISSQLAEMLLNLANDNGTITLSQIRKPAKNFYPAELKKELEAYDHLKSWMKEVNDLLKLLTLSPKNQQYFAERVDYYAAKLKRQSIGNQQLYLLCYLQTRWQSALERTADGFIHHIRQVKNKAQAYARESVYQDWQKAAKNVSKAAEVLHLFIDDSLDQQQSFCDVKKHALKLLDVKDLESVYLFLNNQKRSAEEFEWQYYDQQESLRTGLLRKLFLCLQFSGSEATQRLVSALTKAKQRFFKNNFLVHSDIDLRVVAKKQRQLLLDENESINKTRYEWYLYFQISSRINGQLTLPEIIKYRDLDADLIPQKHWDKEKDLMIKQSQLPKLTEDPNQLIKQTGEDLNKRLHAVSEYLDKEDNRNIILCNPKGKRLWRLPLTNKKSCINNPFFQQMPTTSVADVLRMVDRDARFIDSFEHILGKQSRTRVHEYDLLAILVGNATNQGVYGISQISDRSYEQLNTIQANYLRPETLNAAIDCINNATAKLPIFKHYNIQEDLIHASADGQKFECKRETFKTRYSSKYFGTQKGVSAISLIANHTAINARVIGANEHESHYIFDLLMNNSSEIIPDVLSTDTHGVNHINFALLDLFDYQFAPRYAQVGKVINDMFDISEGDDQRVKLCLKNPINIKRIVKHWDTIQRIAISLKRRKITQATLVRKLSGYKKNHPLLEALTEYNRMVKASYLLNYIDDASLRNYVQRALNRGEAYHQLRRAVSNVNGDLFRGSSDDEIQVWNECARLVTSAIIYFNSSILSRLLSSFEYQQNKDKIEIVKHASPVAWQNINLRGTYQFSLGNKLPTLDEIMLSIDGYLPVVKK